MNASAFPLDDFLARFPEFSDETKYPRSSVMNAGQKAMMHITPEAEGMPMRGPFRDYALMLMAAHLIEVEERTDTDGQSIAGTAFKATIGSVQIENTKPNSFTMDDWDYWLNQTKHGRELLALLEVQVPVGVFTNTRVDSVRDLV